MDAADGPGNPGPSCSNEPLVDASTTRPLPATPVEDLQHVIALWRFDIEALDAVEAAEVVREAFRLAGAPSFSYNTGDGAYGWSARADRKADRVDVTHWRTGADEPDFADRLTPVAALALAERLLAHDGGDLDGQDVELMIESGELDEPDLDQCADCGGSTAVGTPDPHICGGES